ncbi:hypothetical protein BVX97_00820, partial [bacterium E08(2017)]
PDKSDNAYSMFDKIARCVNDNNAMILSQFVFGCTDLHQDGITALQNSCNSNVQWPVTWIQGDSAKDSTVLTGSQVYAISGNQANMIRVNDTIVGNMYEDEDAVYCLLGDLHPPDITLSREEQTRAVFEQMEKALALVDMDFSHVIRTWMYLDNLLEWYDEFNVVRTDFFHERKVFDNLVPASTGIGVSNHIGSSLVTDVLAVKPKTDKVKVFAVPSPMQCPAIDYKSSFSRAVELQLPDYRQLFISGTASIDPDGNTLHLGDTAAQIKLTMEVVDEILKSRDMSWKDTTRAIAYFKNVEDVPLLYEYCEANNLPPMPIAISHSDICRDDLLFEIEFDASVAI